MSTKRQPAGTPTGGQFAPDTKAEGDADLELDLYGLNDSIASWASDQDLELTDEQLDSAVHAAVAAITGRSGGDAASADVADELGREPDSTDYDDAAEDATRLSGFGDYGEFCGVYWDSYAHEAASALGLTGEIDVDAFDVDYMSPDLAEAHAEVMQAYADAGATPPTLSFTTHGGGSQTLDRSQYVSLSLTDAERDRVIDHMDSRPDNFSFGQYQVGYWADGDPGGFDRTFGFVDNHGQWNQVSAVVAEVYPHHGKALEFARRARLDACERFREECDHIGSDEWKQERAERLSA